MNDDVKKALEELEQTFVIVHRMLFCPSCSSALLVGLDERMGRGGTPLLIAVPEARLQLIGRLLRQGNIHAARGVLGELVVVRSRSPDEASTEEMPL